MCLFFVDYVMLSLLFDLLFGHHLYESTEITRFGILQAAIFESGCRINRR